MRYVKLTSKDHYNWHTINEYAFPNDTFYFRADTVDAGIKGDGTYPIIWVGVQDFPAYAFDIEWISQEQMQSEINRSLMNEN